MPAPIPQPRNPGKTAAAADAPRHKEKRPAAAGGRRPAQTDLFATMDEMMDRDKMARDRDAFFSRIVPDLLKLPNAPPIQISLDQIGAWQILVLIRLALLHPDISPQKAGTAAAREFARELESQIALPATVLAEMANWGWAE